MIHDLTLQNCRIIDGTGNPWYYAHIGIHKGKISSILRNRVPEAAHYIDVNKDVVCPGFINPHGHLGRFLHEDPVVRQSIMQGVTLECTGNCGMAMHTMTREYREHLQTFSMEPLPWLSLADWRKTMMEMGIGLNIAPFIGYGTIRASIMGHEGQGGEHFHPTPQQMEEMSQLIHQGMRDGAFGLTVGLSYQVQRNASTSEIISLTRLVAKYGGVFMAHARGGKTAMSEFIEICQQTPIPGCLAHATLASDPVALAQFKIARLNGVEIYFDLYPWIHGSGKNLAFWIFGHQLMKQRDPETWRFWNIRDFKEPLFHETAEILKDNLEWHQIKAKALARAQQLKLENEKRREQLEQEKPIITVPEIWDINDRVGIVYSPSHPEFEGNDTKLPTTLREVTRTLGAEDVWEAARQLFIADDGRTLVVNVSTTPQGRREPHIIASYRIPEAMVSSDASHFITHPRAWGTWPKILQRYVRELNVLRLEDMIRKMTALPAQFLGISDRGIIKPGMWADLVIFNPKTITNRATYQHPRQYPIGIPYVLVNGTVTVENGEYLEEVPGRILTRE
jgi:N-acyl-D-aspartate/D-glutamate deacylase